MASTKKPVKKKKNNDKNIFLKLFDGVIVSAIQEVKSVAGRINIAFDVMMVIVLIVYFFSSGAYSIVRVIVSAVNSDLTEYASDSTPIVMFAIFAFFFLLCFILMYIKEQVDKNTREHLKSLSKKQQ